MFILLNWLLSALLIMLAAYLLPGIGVASFWTALILAAVLGLINIFIKPLIVLLTLPINILTLGLFTLVIDALLIILASTIVKGFSVENFWWALLFGLLLSLLNLIFKDRS